jgi:hypothetical protein
MPLAHFSAVRNFRGVTAALLLQQCLAIEQGRVVCVTSRVCLLPKQQQFATKTRGRAARKRQWQLVLAAAGCLRTGMHSYLDLPLLLAAHACASPSAGTHKLRVYTSFTE